MREREHLRISAPGCPFPHGSGDLIRRKYSNITGNLDKKLQYLSIFIEINYFGIKGASGNKLASDFVLPFSCFSSNHLNFFPIRVEMCYSGSPMK